MTRLLFLMIKSSDNFYNYFPERFLRNPRAQRPLLGRIPKGHLPPWGQCHLSAKMSQLLTVQTYMAYSISLLLGRWKSHPTSQPPVRIFFSHQASRKVAHLRQQDFLLRKILATRWVTFLELSPHQIG